MGKAVNMRKAHVAEPVWISQPEYRMMSDSLAGKDASR
jgi:hypothetical protein